MSERKRFGLKSGIAILMTITVCSVLIYLLAVFMIKEQAHLKEKELSKASEDETQKIIDDNNYPFIDYYDDEIEVSFSAEQVTTAVKSVFDFTGHLSDVKVGLHDDNVIELEGKVADAKKLTEVLPSLEKYSAILGILNDKLVSVGAVITEDENGKAKLDIQSAYIENIKIDTNLIQPLFSDKSGIGSIFNVDYDTIKVTEDKLIFRGEVPDILSGININ